MCVAIAGRVEEILERTEFSMPGLVRFPSEVLRIDLVLVPDVQPGDWVVAHSGYAVARTTPP